MIRKTVSVENSEITKRIFGAFDSNINKLEEAFGVRISNRSLGGEGDTILVEGDEENVLPALSALEYLKKLALSGDIPEQSVDYSVSMVQSGKTDELGELDDGAIALTLKGKPIKPKTVGQKKYAEKIKNSTIVFGIGPAGTGKTYLAVAMAVKALRSHEVSRIILTRPAVEAGERLGFLPGDLQSKIDPYLRPLYDALYEMLGAESCAKMMEKMTIEIAPLAYMRGRTLDDSFIILDEAQNTTPEQMKMFLTRLGSGSKIVVTGDLTQTDLPAGGQSGLAQAVRVLRNVEGIAIHEFDEHDVVRHRLVQRIVMAYDKYDREKKIKKSEGAKMYKPSRKKNG